MDGKKTIYKARYLLDIEITKDTSEEGRVVDIMPHLDIKSEISIRDFDENTQDTSELCDYIEKHFPAQIEELYATMSALEGLVLKLNSLDLKSKAREEIISAICERVEKNLRKRLATTKGRKPDKHKGDFWIEKKHFINNCVKVLGNLKNEGQKVTKTALAESLYSQYQYPLSQLGKKLKLYEITFKELVSKTSQ